MTSLKTMAILAIFLVSAVAAPVHAAYSPVSGDLIKGSLSAVYYVTADGKRMAFPNEATYFSWYPDFSEVKFVTDNDLAALPLSSLVTVRPGARIVKFATSPASYAVAHKGTLRALTNETVAIKIFGSDWTNKIIILPDAFLTSYKFGADITGPGQYWWSNESTASPNIADDLDPSKAPDVYTPIIPALPAPVPTPAQNSTVSTEPVTKNILFVLWDPKRPTAAAPDKDVLKRVVFGGTPSIVDYYKNESNDRVRFINAGILGWYSADHPSDHYWTDDKTVHINDGFKTGTVERASEALKKSDADFDYKKYDADNNGALSTDELAIFVVIPQYGDPTDDTISVVSAETPTPLPMILDGVTINTVGELYVSTPLGSTPQFGTIAHGFAKYVFGLSDIPVSNGAFSLMSNPLTDLYLDPRSRIILGWLTPKTIAKVQEESKQYLPANGSAIRIDRDQPNGPGPGIEYFLIENRQRGIYDNSLPDTGLAVWDVNSGNATLSRVDASTPYNDTRALWHQSNDLTLNFSRELTWTDGVRSGVRFIGLGGSEPVMGFSLEKKNLTVQDLVAPPSPLQ